MFWYFVREHVVDAIFIGCASQQYILTLLEVVGRRSSGEFSTLNVTQPRLETSRRANHRCV